MPDRKLRVFLCHSSQDKPIVRELYQRLNAEGWIDPWLDEINIRVGQDWAIEIEKAVENSDAAIVCLSNIAIHKAGYIQKELRKVLDIADEKPEGTIFVIPVRIDDCEPPRRLKPWQYVDYFPDANQKNKSFQNILNSLKTRLEYKPPLPVNTPEGEVPAHFRNLVFLIHSVAAPRIYKDGNERRPIQVVVDSFNENVLDDIVKVVYHLHPSFPNPDRETANRERRFELKTGAWGEFNLSADIFFKDYERPLTLTRYLNFENY